MTYRVTSNTFKTKFWYINPPKTGTQAVRDFIERSIPKHMLVEHPSFRWHQTVESVVFESNTFDKKNDSFFTTVRNPWARAVSFFYYQKNRMEERIAAYANEEAARQYVVDHPLHVFDYKDKKSEAKLIQQYEMHYMDFEKFILSLPDSQPNYVVRSMADLDSYWTYRDKTAIDFHYYTVYDYIHSEAPNKNLIFPLENAELLEEWLSKAFDLPIDKCRLNQVNVQGVGKTYHDHFSTKMAAIIEDLESYIINLVGYKY